MVNTVNNAAQQAYLNPFQNRPTGAGQDGQVQNRQQQQPDQNAQQVTRSDATSQTEQTPQTQNTQAVQKTETDNPPALQSQAETASGPQQNFQNAERGSVLDITV